MLKQIASLVATIAAATVVDTSIRGSVNRLEAKAAAAYPNAPRVRK